MPHHPPQRLQEKQHQNDKSEVSGKPDKEKLQLAKFGKTQQIEKCEMLDKKEGVLPKRDPLEKHGKHDMIGKAERSTDQHAKLERLNKQEKHGMIGRTVNVEKHDRIDRRDKVDKRDKHDNKREKHDLTDNKMHKHDKHDHQELHVASHTPRSGPSASTFQKSSHTSPHASRLGQQTNDQRPANAPRHQSRGVMQLLEAEKRATDRVVEARRRKVRRLRQAKEEAQREADRYREEKNRIFLEFEESQKGWRIESQRKIDAESKQLMAKIDELVAKNRSKVVGSLVGLVQNIKCEMHKNQQKFSPGDRGRHHHHGSHYDCHDGHYHESSSVDRPFWS